MQKEYGAKLNLKDNFTAVIEKAIKATESLKDKLKSTEKQIDTLGKKKVSIGAKLDPSVNSTLNKLGDKIPKGKTISVKAKDDVTKTVTNIQRDIFKMSRDLNMNLRNPFGNLNRSALNALTTMSALRSAMRGIVTGKAIDAINMHTGSMLSSVAAGTVAGRMAAGSVAKVSKVPSAMMIHKRNNELLKKSSRRHATWPSEADYPGAASDWIDRIKDRAGFGYGDVKPIIDLESGRKTIFDEDYADIVGQQKDKFRNKFGRRYLPNWRVTTLEGEDVETSVVNRPLNKMERGYYKAKEAIGNKLSPIAQTAKVKLDVVTTDAMSKINAFKNKISNSKFGEIGMKLKFAGKRGLYEAKGIGGLLADKSSKVFEIVTRFKDLGAMTAIGRIISAASILKKPIVFTVKAITSAAHAAINALKTAIKGLAVAAGAIVIGGATKAATGAADLQTNILSIEHFVKYANTKQFSEGKGPLKTGEEIKAESANYIDMLRKYAAVTPFGDTEVIGAGRRAVNIMGGNLSDAEELVKIAGDMAALNPGKTIMDAMEALGDLKVGEMERMKEFGLKISAKQFKGLVGKGEGDDLTEEEQTSAYKMVMNQKLKPMFGGGAKKRSATAEGKWSTLTGTVSSTLDDVGTMFLPGIESGLDKAIAWVESAKPRFIEAFKPIADGFNSFMAGDGASGWFSQIATSIQPAIDAFSNLFSKVDMAKAFADVVSAAAAGIKLAMEILAPVFNVVGVIVADIMMMMSTRVDDVKLMFQNFSTIWKSTWPILSDMVLTAWSAIKPALEALWNIAQVIVDVFTLAWPAISSVISSMWAVTKPVLAAIAGALEIIAWAADKAHSALTWVINKKNNVSGNGSSPAGDAPSERAVGMNYIPYNGYQVSAHRGEAILTRAEADQWREGKGKNNNAVVINIHDPVVRDDMDLDRLGTLLANKMKEVYGNMGVVPA